MEPFIKDPLGDLRSKQDANKQLVFEKATGLLID
jgi:hypothetical protein